MKSDPMLAAALPSPHVEARASAPPVALADGAAAVLEGTTDATLLAAVRDERLRDAVALAARLHGQAIGRFAMSMLGSQADSEEVVQETLLAAYVALPQYRGEGSVRGFLFTIARRTVARTLEARARRGSALDEEAAKGDQASAEAELLTQQRAARLRAALAELRPSEREAVLIRYGSECSFREVAEACGCEEAAARQRVSRAVKHLRDLLKDEDAP